MGVLSRPVCLLPVTPGPTTSGTERREEWVPPETNRSRKEGVNPKGPSDTQQTPGVVVNVFTGSETSGESFPEEGDSDVTDTLTLHSGGPGLWCRETPRDRVQTPRRCSKPLLASETKLSLSRTNSFVHFRSTSKDTIPRTSQQSLTYLLTV